MRTVSSRVVFLPRRRGTCQGVGCQRIDHIVMWTHPCVPCVSWNAAAPVRSVVPRVHCVMQPYLSRHVLPAAPRVAPGRESGGGHCCCSYCFGLVTGWTREGLRAQPGGGGDRGLGHLDPVR
ncbi:hypothetical protein E2C01_072436 [Portunus trituberculatus]|uniref:Uncharacterized protein n=1 Tax=Portunus trituberculatus TaxID=210409 RepID=A0A5B7I7Q5_PORTR|nr:hypothetical protein [Portunus trituberculatus]